MSKEENRNDGQSNNRSMYEVCVGELLCDEPSRVWRQAPARLQNILAVWPSAEKENPEEIEGVSSKHVRAPWKSWLRRSSTRGSVGDLPSDSIASRS